MKFNLHNKSFLKLVVRMEEIEIQQCNLDKERKEIIKEINRRMAYLQNNQDKPKTITKSLGEQG